MEDGRRIGPRVRILSNTIRLNIDRKLNALDLTAQQSFVLRYLWEHDSQVIYPKDIERRFNLTHPTVSGLLQRLEGKGFIVCEPDPDDRRYKRVTLTPPARECQQEICRHIHAMEQTMTAGMTEAEIGTLISLLDRATANLSAEQQKEASNT